LLMQMDRNFLPLIALFNQGIPKNISAEVKYATPHCLDHFSPK
jgi:hypothetical protein